MKLSRDEEAFLRHWIYDETHFENGQGSAKLLQLQYRAVPADLAMLIAAAMPDPDDQEKAALGPQPSVQAKWPWSEEELGKRLAEAQAVLGTGCTLASRGQGQH